MPRVVEGLLKAIVAIAVTVLVAYTFLVVIMNIVGAIDRLDAGSMELTGLPARSTTISSNVELIAKQSVILAIIVPIGIMIVYFIHRPKR